jgi:hypothetical protein
LALQQRNLTAPAALSNSHAETASKEVQVTTLMEYAMVRLELVSMGGRFDPRAAAVEPTAWQRLRARLRSSH